MNQWTCPECRKPVTLKKGSIKIHHFAHRPPVTCEYGARESDAHYSCKMEVYEELRRHPGVSHCEIEYTQLKGVRPDVFFVANGERIVVEVQRSTLSVEEIVARTDIYSALGVSVLWLCLWSDKLGRKKYRINAWEDWIHETYRGRAYYWRSKVGVVPVHFDDHILYTPSKEWYDKSGNHHIVGSKEKVSDVFRDPVLAPRNPHLLRDMKSMPSYRGKWSVRIDDAPHWWSGEDRYSDSYLAGLFSSSSLGFSKPFPAKFTGSCTRCPERIAVGDEIVLHPSTRRVSHAKCVS